MKLRDGHFVIFVGELGHLGGAERQALRLAEMLRDEIGARVSFLAWVRFPGPFGDMVDEARFPLHIYPLAWRQQSRLRSSYIAKAFRLLPFARFVREQVSPDFLLPYDTLNTKVAGLIWKRVGSRYTWWNQRDEGRDLRGTFIERHIVATVPDVVSNSWSGRDALVEKFGLSRDRVRIIGNAVPLPPETNGSDWRRKLGVEAADFLLLMVANLTRFKDHDTLLEAFAHLRMHPAGSRCRLALAGRPDDRAAHLEEKAAACGISAHVDFLGEVRDVAPLFAAADMVVHSSVTEGLPNAVLEAMSHGKCVVGTDIPGMRQALGEPRCDDFLVPVRGSRALADKVIEFMQSEQKRIGAGRENRDRIAREFSPAKHLEVVLEGIERFMTKPS
jgi:glycosyltransferase involved in cell wall biosynthesis